MTNTKQVSKLTQSLRSRAADARLDAGKAQERGDVALVHYFRGKAEAYDIAADMAESDWYTGAA